MSTRRLYVILFVFLFSVTVISSLLLRGVLWWPRSFCFLPPDDVNIFTTCSDRILTCRIKSIRSPAKVGLVVTDLITSPIVSWEWWETPPPPPPPPAPRLCCHSLLNHRRGKTSLLLSSARLVYVLVDVDWNTFSCG